MEKRVFALLLVLCMLSGCGVEAQSEPEEKMVTIILTAPLFDETIEEYVAGLDDSTAKVYDADHYTIEITEEQRLEKLEALYDEILPLLQENAGDGAAIEVEEDFRKINVTGEIEELFSFTLVVALMADTVQAYSLIDPTDRSYEIILNGEKAQ